MTKVGFQLVPGVAWGGLEGPERCTTRVNNGLERGSGTVNLLSYDGSRAALSLPKPTSLPCLSVAFLFTIAFLPFTYDMIL